MNACGMLWCCTAHLHCSGHLTVTGQHSLQHSHVIKAGIRLVQQQVTLQQVAQNTDTRVVTKSHDLHSQWHSRQGYTGDFTTFNLITRRDSGMCANESTLQRCKLADPVDTQIIQSLPAAKALSGSACHEAALDCTMHDAVTSCTLNRQCDWQQGLSGAIQVPTAQCAACWRVPVTTATSLLPGRSLTAPHLGQVPDLCSLVSADLAVVMLHLA